MSMQSKAAPSCKWIGAVGGLLIAAGLAGGCDAQPVAVVPTNEVIGVCVSPVTGWRVADTYCGLAGPTGLALDTGGYYFDYFAPTYTGLIPAVGIPVPSRSVTRTITRTTRVSRSVPSTGGSAVTLRTNLASKATTAKPPTNKGGSAGTAPTVKRGGFGVTSKGSTAKPSSPKAGS